MDQRTNNQRTNEAREAERLRRENERLKRAMRELIDDEPLYSSEDEDHAEHGK
jgi:hypothetical protein